MENTQPTNNTFEYDQAAPSYETTSPSSEANSERLSETENDRHMREISETILEIEKSNKAGVESYVLGSGAMLYAMREAGFNDEEISSIMSERRKKANHPMDLDVAVPSNADLAVMQNQLNFESGANQASFGEYNQTVDLMVRPILSGFEPEEVTINGNNLRLQATDEMLFEKTNALVADIDEKQPKWEADRGILKEIIKRKYDFDAAVADLYLADRYQEYSTRRLEVALDGLADQLDGDPSKTVADLIPEEKILEYLPNIGNLLEEFKGTDESTLLTAVAKIEGSMLPQWADVDSEAGAVFIR